MVTNNPKDLDEFVEDNRHILEKYVLASDDEKSEKSYSHTAFVYRKIGDCKLKEYSQSCEIDLWRDIASENGKPRYSFSIYLGKKPIPQKIYNEIEYLTISYEKEWEKWSKNDPHNPVYSVNQKFFSKPILELGDCKINAPQLFPLNKAFKPNARLKKTIFDTYNEKNYPKFLTYYFDEYDLDRACNTFFNVILPELCQNADVEIKQIRLARKGQGKFRSKLFESMGGCCITGCQNESLITASHIKPWAKSNNKEKLDPNNGLLLISTLDKAFDRFLISLDKNGQIMISKTLTNEDLNAMGISKNTQILNPDILRPRENYLKYHRSIFKKKERERI